MGEVSQNIMIDDKEGGRGWGLEMVKKYHIIFE
jgi:hypothetical protein